MDTQICLTCLCKPNKAHSVNEIPLENVKIFDMIVQLVPLFLEQHVPTLPDRICAECLKSLLISYKFQKQCLDSVQILHKLFPKNFLNIEGQQKVSQPKLEAEDVEYETNEYKSNDENTIESLPVIKDAIKMPAQELAIHSLIVNKDIDTEVSFKQDGENGENHLKQKNDAEGTLNIKLQCNDNSNKNLHGTTDGDDVEEISVAKIQCTLCNKIFKQSQGLASHMSKTHLKKHLYQCQKCDKGFSVEELFIRHCHRHLGIKPFPCTHCDKAFDTKSSLNQHLLCHSKDSSYLCTICGKKFHRIDVLKQHMLRHDDEKLFQCSKCDITFKSFSDHIKHIKTHKADKRLSTSNQKIVHTDKKSFKCGQCHKEFISSTTFKIHQKTHTSEKHFRCQFCSKAFGHSNDLKKHTRCFHNDKNCELEDEITMDCLIGNKKDLKMSFEQILPESVPNNKEGLIENIEDVERVNVKVEEAENENKKETTVHPKTPLDNIKEQESMSLASTDSTQCDLCNQTFKNSQGLARHRSSTHFKKHLYQCDKCDRGFSVEEYYIKHRNRHLGIKTFKCNQCGKAFETNSILNQHLISHSKLTPHLCTICGKSFRRIDGLRQHMLRHGNERPFQCAVCPKSFKCLSDKLKHMIIHDGKRYECNICGSRLATSESLSQHQMTHTGEKPFKCSYCDKSFISLSNMRCHERIHTGEKPYKCQYCWKTFRQSNDRKKHTNRMHKNETANRKSEQIQKTQEQNV